MKYDLVNKSGDVVFSVDSLTDDEAREYFKCEIKRYDRILWLALDKTKVAKPSDDKTKSAPADKGKAASKETKKK